MTSIQLCLVLHNHQPVGNFAGVIEQAYQDSYLPFLEVFEQYADLRIALHTSGPLMEWLEQQHNEYLDRVAALVAAGRIEIIGGPFYEPILTMIPPRDRVGQIREYTRWLEQRFQAKVQGMWTPERVWEQSLTRDLADAGMQYTVLDDFHFRNAGLTNDQLHGCFLTEDDGRVLRVFPGSETLRYTIPFADPQETIRHLRQVAEQHPGAVVVFGDDGEKFGTWPDTKKHVYDDGWLRRFFDALSENRDWLATSTLAQATETAATVGKIYLPDASYREMTEWVLPVARHLEYENLRRDFEHDERWPRLEPFLRGGFWRNFRVRYSEANEMYARMMDVSRRLERVASAEENTDREALEAARQALYRGQCNCAYWHGAFGGIYLPHLRNAVFGSLIEADNALDRAEGRVPWVNAWADDFNFDGQPEVRLESDRFVCLLAPVVGGRMYEFDVRSIRHNLLATLTRRPEAYHRKVLAGAAAGGDDVASIHDRVVFKQKDLDQRIQYDSHERKSLIDHFWDDDTTLEAVASGQAMERGDFATGSFKATIRRAEQRYQVMMQRNGNAWGVPLQITKGVTLETGSDVVEIAYRIEGIPPERTFHFGLEMNFSGLPANADDRYFFSADGDKLGHLGERLDLHDLREIGLADEWLGIRLRLESDKPLDLWTLPIETVSQSEGGFELVHQSTMVQPHWRITGDAEGRWSVVLRLHVDTRAAEERWREQAHATVGG